ncbi:hypothetical protein NEMIN01_1878 [Nematocida minor]|uniref:uncharacterized protein n=1 Tax=Nematocida minor TaxID=1912983 RepID=UPI00221F361C|nr:uncharacterized protein NEMIN01_1878 [Nematocida minor]KAI5192209.1 hypothetical protein NEMIN01_1878 [Nematocida minor]
MLHTQTNLIMYIKSFYGSGMHWTPSTLHTFEEKPSALPDKKIYIETKGLSSFTNLNRSAENIFAGDTAANKKKPSIRPVMLVVSYMSELIFDPEDLPESSKCIEINEDFYTSFNELSSAVKESMRVEKTVIQRLERSQGVETSKYYITTKTKTFFVSKQRLLGEILKAQRKIERIRPLTVLSVQMALECFIKKLCVLKVIADKMYPEESSRLFI